MARSTARLGLGAESDALFKKVEKRVRDKLVKQKLISRQEARKLPSPVELQKMLLASSQEILNQEKIFEHRYSTYLRLRGSLLDVVSRQKKLRAYFDDLAERVCHSENDYYLVLVEIVKGGGHLEFKGASMRPECRPIN